MTSVTQRALFLAEEQFVVVENDSESKNGTFGPILLGSETLLVNSNSL